MSLKPQKLSQQSKEKSIPPWHLQLPPCAGGWRPASPKLEQHILVGAIFIWSPYVSHFKENPSICLFLVERQVKVHQCMTPSCWHHPHHMMSWMLSTLHHIYKVKNSLFQKTAHIFSATQLFCFSFMLRTCIIYFPMQISPSFYSTPLVAPIYKGLIQRHKTSFFTISCSRPPCNTF